MTKSQKKEKARLIEIEKQKAKANKRIAIFKDKEAKYKKQLLECKLNPDNKIKEPQKLKAKYNVLMFRSNIPKNHKPSIGEQRVQRFLLKHRINHKREVNFEKLPLLRFDFYLPGLKICIEFDGIQHFEKVEDFDHGNIFALNKRKKNDERKNYFCKKNGLKMIRIKYDEIDYTEKILKKHLIKGEPLVK